MAYAVVKVQEDFICIHVNGLLEDVALLKSTKLSVHKLTKRFRTIMAYLPIYTQLANHDHA